MRRPLKARFRTCYESFELNSTNTLTLIISIIALVISIKTCKTSDEALEVAKKQGEPFIQVYEVKLVDTLNNSSFISIELTIKNLGQIPAINISGEMDYNLGMSPSNKDGNSATRRLIPSLGQGAETRIQITKNKRNMTTFKAGSSRMYETFFCYGTIFYTDAFSNEDKKVDWTFELPLKNESLLRQLTLFPSKTFLYESPYKVQAQ